MLLSTIYMFYVVSIPSSSNSWDDLGKFVIVIGTVIVFILNVPLVISSIGMLHYLKRKNTYKLCMILNIISIILYTLLIFLFIYLDVLNIFNDYYNGYPYTELKIILSIIIFFLLICPLIVNTIELYKEENNLTYKMICHRFRFIIITIIAIILITICYNLFRSTVINTNKIEVTENNMYSYSDFKSELESRNLIQGQDVITLSKITALDSGGKYGYSFSSGPYTDFSTLSVNTDKKFPLFVYDTYTSLIKRSYNTPDYYYIGLDDWYVNWVIYYVNGNIYAALDEVFNYGGKGEISSELTKYNIVVSEEETITIYNSKNNYYVKGGGILDTRSGAQKSEFPTTTDIYDNKCMRIKVVDKVDAKTLDKIAKELSV